MWELAEICKDAMPLSGELEPELSLGSIARTDVLTKGSIPLGESQQLKVQLLKRVSFRALTYWNSELCKSDTERLSA